MRWHYDEHTDPSCSIIEHLEQNELWEINLSMLIKVAFYRATFFLFIILLNINYYRTKQNIQKIMIEFFFNI